MRTFWRWWAAAATALMTPATALGDGPPEVGAIRVAGGGLQPQAVVANGVVHVVYFAGEARAGDIFWVRSTDGGKRFGEPVRVNSEPGTATAIGTIRGPHLALGNGERLHVTWIGAGASELLPLWYTRLADGGETFEPQRNLITQHFGLDAGASVAADAKGRVWVTWHAPGGPGNLHDEQDRRVWVVTSSDEGRTFSTEKQANTRPTGCCGCCAMRALGDGRGGVHVLYRGANKVVERHMWLLSSSDGGETFVQTKLDDWTIGQCMMSSCAFSQGPRGALAAWESRSQVYWAPIGGAHVAAPGDGPNRKHPVVAANDAGYVLMAWTEGTAWNKGGAVAWQLYDPEGSPVAERAGRLDGLPPWGSVAVFARPGGSGGGFTVVY